MENIKLENMKTNIKIDTQRDSDTYSARTIYINMPSGISIHINIMRYRSLSDKEGVDVYFFDKNNNIMARTEAFDNEIKTTNRIK